MANAETGIVEVPVGLAVDGQAVDVRYIYIYICGRVLSL